MSARSQWVGVEDAPETQAISLEIPDIGKRLSVGFSVINDRVFVERKTQLFIDFSYRLPLSTPGDNLFLGLKAGGTSLRLLADQLQVYGSDAADPYLQNNSNFVPNIGVGLLWQNKSYFLSLSVPRLLNTERFRYNEGQVSRATDRPHLFFATGWYKNLNPGWVFSPSIIVNAVANAPVDYTLETRFSYQEKLKLGLQYSLGSGMGLTGALFLTQNIQVGYAYLTPVQAALRNVRLGTHEMVLKIKLNNGKRGDDLAHHPTPQNKKII